MKKQSIISEYLMLHDSISFTIDEIKSILESLKEQKNTKEQAFKMLKYFNSVMFIPSFEYFEKNAMDTLKIESLQKCLQILETNEYTQAEFHNCFTDVLCYMVNL